MTKKKKVLAYEDYLAKIPKSWEEPLREIHAIRWMHYDQERRKKMPLDKQILADQKELEKTIKQLGFKYRALI